MSNVSKKAEIVGISSTSFADAVKSAVAWAAKTIRHISWFEVIEERGMVMDGNVQEFQVVLKVGFKLEG